MLYGIIPPFLGATFYGLVVYYGLLWFLPYIADRFIAPKVGGFAATLVFPAAAGAGGGYVPAEVILRIKT